MSQEKGPTFMYPFYLAPRALDEALAMKAEHGDEARVIAGGTDLLIELDRGVRKTPNGNVPGLIDLSHVSGLAEIWEANGQIHLGALVTHNQCVASPLIVEKAFPLVRACWEIGAPQIRNRATVAGNIVTASPANDAIVPLRALNATITVQSAARGERTLPLEQFITGFRQVDLAPDEILTRISFAPLTATQQGTFIKLGLRRAQAISVITVSAIIDCDDDPATAPIREARISLGAVAPVIVRADAAEAYLTGKVLTDDVIAEAAQLALASTSPIDDIRGTATYRRGMVQTLVGRILRQIAAGQARAGWHAQPVLLWGGTDGKWPVLRQAQQPAAGQLSMVNGQPVALPAGMTLLDSLRAAGFVGVKEGCAEGECGACTVFLDGIAVMACLLPAERAVGSSVMTV
ncbi:MAG TPA: FAD binding domain-containing protein, partial [Caldilineaceae bacterium]|nr:FAD binding domain-containing protein [Caldilineaceae bacterium]